MSQTIPTPWFNIPRSDPPPRLRLFCFPYAGGSALIYRNWQNYLPPGVSVLPVHLPARGGRFREAPYVSMAAVVSAVTQAIEPYLDLPFAFFGHSMGALMGFELAHAVRERFDKQPKHLFVSGSRGPHQPRIPPPIRDLPDQEFIARLEELNGTPNEVLNNSELMMVMMKPLRADFEIVETYPPFSGPPLDCPITALGGEDDNLVPIEDLETWKIQTTNSFNSRVLPGDHFFIHSNEPNVLRIVSEQIHMTLTKLS